MPWDEVLPKFKAGKLHSGSKQGPPVTNRKQAIAIMLHEKGEAAAGKEEYKPNKRGSKPLEGLKKAGPK